MTQDSRDVRSHQRGHRLFCSGKCVGAFRHECDASPWRKALESGLDCLVQIVKGSGAKASELAFRNSGREKEQLELQSADGQLFQLPLVDLDRGRTYFIEVCGES